MQTISGVGAFSRHRKSIVQSVLVKSAVCFGLFITSVAATTPLQTVKPEGETHIASQVSHGDLIQIDLTQTRLSKNYPYEADLLWGYFTDTAANYVVTSISIRDGGHPIEVPLSAFADLANVRSASIVGVRHGFAVNIDGGDTGTAYRAKITFANGVAVGRVIYDDEFPEQVGERTSYSFISPTSPD